MICALLIWNGRWQMYNNRFTYLASNTPSALLFGWRLLLLTGKIGLSWQLTLYITCRFTGWLGSSPFVSENHGWLGGEENSQRGSRLPFIANNSVDSNDSLSFPVKFAKVELYVWEPAKLAKKTNKSGSSSAQPLAISFSTILSRAFYLYLIFSFSFSCQFRKLW